DDADDVARFEAGGAEGGEIGLAIDQEGDARRGLAAPMGASVAQHRLGRVDHALPQLSLGITRCRYAAFRAAAAKQPPGVARRRGAWQTGPGPSAQNERGTGR